jgi:hypothetical protein
MPHDGHGTIIGADVYKQARGDGHWALLHRAILSLQRAGVQSVPLRVGAPRLAAGQPVPVDCRLSHRPVRDDHAVRAQDSGAAGRRPLRAGGGRQRRHHRHDPRRSGREGVAAERRQAGQFQAVLGAARVQLPRRHRCGRREQGRGGEGSAQTCPSGRQAGGAKDEYRLDPGAGRFGAVALAGRAGDPRPPAPACEISRKTASDGHSRFDRQRARDYSCTTSPGPVRGAAAAARGDDDAAPSTSLALTPP